MAWWQRKKKPDPKPVQGRIAHKGKRGHFFSTETDRLLEGWDTQSNSIDYYLNAELTMLRARSRKMARQNNLGHRYVSLLQNNVVGEHGIQIQSQVLAPRGERLDDKANKVIESAFEDWGAKHCDYLGERTFVEFQQAVISALSTDGEAIIRKHIGAGKYGLQLELVDSEKLDINKTEGSTRLGVQRNKSGRVIRYHFKTITGYDVNRSYSSSEKFEWEEPAESIMHLYLREYADQSRGIPWMTPGLERAKHLEKFTEAAIVRARATASRIAALSTDPDDPYRGDEEAGAGDIQFDITAAGEVWDLGTKTLQQYDADYPTAMYEPFVKQNIRDVAAGWNVSYQSLSLDLSDTSFGSARTGIMEEREEYKSKQRWLSRQFVSPIYELWLFAAYNSGMLVFDGRRTERNISDYYNYRCQPKRWAWIDPAKDSKSNEIELANYTKSRSQIIRETGGDPETTFAELAKEKELLDSLGLAVTVNTSDNQDTEEKTDDNDD